MLTLLITPSGKKKLDERRVPDEVRKEFLNYVSGFAWLVYEGGIKPDGAIEMIMRLIKKKESR